MVLDGRFHKTYEVGLLGNVQKRKKKILNRYSIIKSTDYYSIDVEDGKRFKQFY